MADEMGRSGSEASTTERWYPPASLLSIVVLTIAGLIAGTLFPGADFESGTAAIFVGVMLFVGLSNIFAVRLIVLPQILASPNATSEAPVTVGYGFVIAVAIYGLVTAVAIGQGLLVLPFAVIALGGYYLVWTYLGEIASRKKT